MRSSHLAALPLLATAGLLALAVTGCAPAAHPTGGSSASPAPAAAPSASPAHQQGKFTGVPKNCPAVDEVSVAVHLLMHGVYPSAIGGSLVCEYYVDSSNGSPVVSMNFGSAPGATAAAWKAAVRAAQPGMKSVSGTGDGAFYLSTAKYHEFDFFSGTTSCDVTASTNFDEASLANLADFVLDD